jgi:hypothetical protein
VTGWTLFDCRRKVVAGGQEIISKPSRSGFAPEPSGCVEGGWHVGEGRAATPLGRGGGRDVYRRGSSHLEVPELPAVGPAYARSGSALNFPGSTIR